MALSISGGRTVTALVTRDSAIRLGLKVGTQVCAIFQATSVILATLD